MRCPNCQTLNPANAKFCLECGNRLLICPNCGTVNLPFAKFCIECGTALQAGKASGAAEISQPTSPAVVDALPSHNGSTLLNPELLLPPEERRVVTIMFADIIGSTPLADHLEPEDMRAILTGYFNLMAEQIRRHGGTIEKYIGDAVMAVFGAPSAHEDDPDRAIRAALDMQTALTLFNEQRQALDPEANRLQMRIGINTGEVAIPNNIFHQRQDFLITGDAVNVAARLQQVATPDTILAGERTYLATREVFDFRPIAPLHIKGKAEPIMASVVLGLRKPAAIVTQHPRGIEGRQVRMIGRALELTLLHASYARVEAEHHPHLITILGAPGIGKSRLIHEFILREQERFKSTSTLSNYLPPRVLSGHCPPYGEGITYWPLVEILRSLLEVQDDDNIDMLQQRFIELVRTTLTNTKRSESTEEIASTILRSIGRGLSGKAILPERERLKHDNQLNTHNVSAKQPGTQIALLRAWRVFLEALAEQQPLIIVIDDLQWADEALLDLLEYLTDRITSVPILFLCPARPDFFERRRDWGGGRRNFTTIELEALSREESSELVDALLNTTDLPEILRNTILSRAEGNPFFVEEIIRMFIDQGVLVCEDDHEHDIDCWRIGSRNEALLHELISPGDQSEDSQLNAHYVLSLPRVPDTIQGVLAARVDLLNPTEKLVLQHAAIAGRTFWLSALHMLAPNLSLETLLEVLASLTQREFVMETEKEVRSPVEYDSVFIFKHVLIRDVVYNNIPRTRRSEEHERLALWLEELVRNEQVSFAELLAYHYQQALANWSRGLAVATIEADDQLDTTAPPIRLTRPELRRRTITYLIMAGDQALNTYYAIRSLQAYKDVLELLGDNGADLPDRIAIYERLGDAYFQRGNLDEAWQQYRKSLHLTRDHPEAAATRGTTPLYLYERLAELATRWLGSFDTPPDLQEAHTYIDAGLQLLEGKPLSREKVAFLTYQAFWYIRQLETATYTQKAELAEQALTSGHNALRLAEELNNPSALSLVLDALGFIYGEYHKYNEVHQIQHRRLKLESQLSDREELYDLYYSLGKAHEQIASYSSALMWFGRAWSNAQTMESPSLLLSSMTGRMRAWRQWNRWDNARQVALDILHLIEQYQQDEKRQLWALETLATIAYRRGEQEQGDHYARQYKRLSDQQIDRSDGRNASSSTLHSIYLAREDWTRATADYKEKLENSEPLPAPEVLSTLAELLIMTGESEEMQRNICERALTVAEESGARKSLAIALRARGRMYMEQQEWKLAQSDLKSALRHCEVLDLPWEHGNTLYQMGLFYKRRALAPKESKQSNRNADIGRARYHFEKALGFFESLKAGPSIEHVRQALMQDTTTRV